MKHFCWAIWNLLFWIGLWAILGTVGIGLTCWQGQAILGIVMLHTVSVTLYALN
jgi:hypothetical protein